MKAWEGTIVSGLFGRSSRGPLCRACSSESKERGKDQDERGCQKVETCRREKEEKTDRVPSTTLGWDTSKGCYSFGRHEKLPDYEN